MTAVFLKQRFNSDTSTVKFNTLLSLCLIFITTFFGQFIFAFFIDPGILLVVYFFNITILVVWDKIANRKMKQ